MKLEADTILLKVKPRRGIRYPRRAKGMETFHVAGDCFVCSRADASRIIREDICIEVSATEIDSLES